MARSRIPVRGAKWFEKYPGVYARTGSTWNGRPGQRDTRALFNLFGLNTAMDPLHKEEGESPYLTNLRFFGEKELVERAQLMSRRGARYISGKSPTIVDRKESDGDSYIELCEGKTIQSTLSFVGKLEGISLKIQNTEKASGFLRISVRNEKGKEITNGVVDLEKVPSVGFSNQRVRFIMAAESSPVTVRLDVLDDVDPDTCSDSAPIQARKIRILSNGESNHQFSYVELPNLDECLKEQPIVWSDGVSAPLYGTITDTSSVIPRLHLVCAKGIDYLIYPMKTSTGVSLCRTQISNGATVTLDSPVWKDAKAVRGVQAEGYFYYVDGDSVLQRVNLTTWVTEPAVPAQSEIGIVYTGDLAQAQIELTAKKGASLILYHQNRIYLSGFKDDPNIVHFSLIDGTAPRVDQFNVTNRFYSPDNAPEDTSCDPITALASLNDNVVVFRRESLSVFTLAGGFDFGSPQQLSPEGNRFGVLNQEAVAYGRNLIYFFNPTEGVMRFAGSLSKVESLKVDNILAAIPDENRANVFLEYFDFKVRLYFSLEPGTPNNRSLVMYTSFAKPSPWFMDINTPVNSTVGVGAEDKLYALHSQYPSVYEVDAKNQLTDFGSIIEAEYHTAYISSHDPFGWEMPRRVFAMVMANSTNSYYLGIDYDHRDKPSVWRKFVSARVDDVENNDAVFAQTEQAGIKTVQATVRSRPKFYQLRIKTYCYRSQMELVALKVESGFKPTV